MRQISNDGDAKVPAHHSTPNFTNATPPQHGPVSILHTFYTAVAQRDRAAMGACYHPDARFGDPVFPDLDATHARAMWKMLLNSGTDLTIHFTVLDEDAHGGRAQWEAYYTFSRSGRKVHNVIATRITLKDG